MADAANSKDKSNSSSFEDLSQLPAAELRDAAAAADASAAVTPDTATASPPPAEDGAKAAAANDDTIDVIGNGQLLKTVLRKGNGGNTQPQRGDVCRVSYTGRLDNGTLVEQRTDVQVQVGDVELVQGLDMSMPLMAVGELAQVRCDSRFAYGSTGVPLGEGAPLGLVEAVPPLARITYELELLECAEEQDIAEQPFAKRRDNGVAKRERGNFWYSRGDCNLAIQLYRRSLEYLNDNGPGVEVPAENEMTNSQLQELLEVRIKVYNNLAAAQMKIAAYDTALQSVDNVLRCQPDNVKALFRKGKILESKGDAGAAIPVLQKGATLDPDSKAIQQLLAKCIMKARRDERNEKDFYRKMMGQATKADEKRNAKGAQPACPAGGQQQQQQQAQFTDAGRDVPKQLKLWGYLMGSILIGVAGVAMYRYKYF